MILEGPSIDENVIKKYNNEFAEKRLESLIHRGLKGGGGIAQAKRHYAKLLMAMMGAESCPANVVVLHQNLMIPLQQIQFQKPLSTSQLI